MLRKRVFLLKKLFHMYYIFVTPPRGHPFCNVHETSVSVICAHKNNN